MSLADLYALTLCGGLLSRFIWISFTSKGAWPFNCYPMFSVGLNPEQMRYYRIGIKTHSGESCWWQPKFPRHQRRVSLLLERLDRQAKTPQYHQHKQAYLAEAARLICAERPELSNAILCIYQREMITAANGCLDVANTLLEEHALSPLLNKTSS